MRVFPLLECELAKVFCQALFKLGTGIQTLVFPVFFKILTRVVTSKVRHWPAAGAN
jgi:hypothetical protein